MDELPAAGSRANKYLGFDSAGLPALLTGVVAAAVVVAVVAAVDVCLWLAALRLYALSGCGHTTTQQAPAAPQPPRAPGPAAAMARLPWATCFGDAVRGTGGQQLHQTGNSGSSAAPNDQHHDQSYAKIIRVAQTAQPAVRNTFSALCARLLPTIASNLPQVMVAPPSATTGGHASIWQTYSVRRAPYRGLGRDQTPRWLRAALSMQAYRSIHHETAAFASARSDIPLVINQAPTPGLALRSRQKHQNDCASDITSELRADKYVSVGAMHDWRHPETGKQHHHQITLSRAQNTNTLSWSPLRLLHDTSGTWVSAGESMQAPLAGGLKV